MKKLSTVVAKKDETNLLVILLTKSFYPFWPPLYVVTSLVKRCFHEIFVKQVRERKFHEN